MRSVLVRLGAVDHALLGALHHIAFDGGSAGLFAALHAPGEYDALRPRAMKMDRKTQMPEIRKLLAAPDYMLGSV